ncbi:MAG TPA: emp24/gp25L/p24 family protein [Candidatus Dormibacteraeota bacterium]|jgi:hypothetical protein|nr:emp24/gp25L/p24 family protein [Candidatus Dormibacteraeota bacterium]
MQTTKTKSGRNTLLIAVAVIVVAVIVGAVFAANMYLLHPVVNTPLVNQTVSVAPGTTQKFTFNVPAGATNARVTGTFSTAGGSGNDIIVYITNNGTTIYNSTQVSATNFAINLNPGQTYSMVFDNTFSTVSVKDVSAQATLTYNK